MKERVKRLTVRVYGERPFLYSVVDSRRQWCAIDTVTHRLGVKRFDSKSGRIVGILFPAHVKIRLLLQ